MIALGLGPLALTLLGPGELVEAAVKLFDLSARAGRGFDQFLCQGKGEAVGHDPFSVAVRGDQLEQAHRKRHLLGAYFQARAPAARRRGDRVQGLIARLLVAAHQPVASQGCEKRPTGSVNQLQVLAAAVSGVEEQRAGLDFSLSQDVDKYALKVLVLSPRILLWGVDAAVQGQKITGPATAVH